MNTHIMRLASRPFSAIISGHKTIESRLYDDKRQLIQLGDSITFVNRENSDQTITVRVIGLLRYATFHDMFTHNDPARFGGANAQILEEQISEFYTIGSQKTAGVLGIEFELIK